MPENPTGFFDYAEDEQDDHSFYSFKQLNENNIKWVSQLEDKDMQQIRHRLSDPSTDVELVSFFDNYEHIKGIYHHTSKQMYGKPLYHCD